MDIEACSITQTGPCRFYCAAEDCEVLMDTDTTNMFCRKHASWEPRNGETIPRLKNGYTPQMWHDMVQRTRDDERRKGWHTTMTGIGIPVTQASGPTIVGDSPGNCMPHFDMAAYLAGLETDRKKKELLQVLDEYAMLLLRVRQIVETW
jgi:hypothetical protein